MLILLKKVDYVQLCTQVCIALIGCTHLFCNVSWTSLNCTLLQKLTYLQWCSTELSAWFRISSLTQIVTKPKLWQHFKCDNIQIVKTRIVTKFKLWQNLCCGKLKLWQNKIMAKLKFWQNSKINRTQIVTKLKCDKTKCVEKNSDNSDPKLWWQNLNCEKIWIVTNPVKKT